MAQLPSPPPHKRSLRGLFSAGPFWRVTPCCNLQPKSQPGPPTRFESAAADISTWILLPGSVSPRSQLHSPSTHFGILLSLTHADPTATDRLHSAVQTLLVERRRLRPAKSSEDPPSLFTIRPPHGFPGDNDSPPIPDLNTTPRGPSCPISSTDHSEITSGCRLARPEAPSPLRLGRFRPAPPASRLAGLSRTPRNPPGEMAPSRTATATMPQQPNRDDITNT